MCGWQDPKTTNLSPMADEANTRGSIQGLGSLLYICDLPQKGLYGSQLRTLLYFCVQEGPSSASAAGKSTQGDQQKTASQGEEAMEIDKAEPSQEAQSSMLADETKDGGKKGEQAADMGTSEGKKG